MIATDLGFAVNFFLTSSTASPRPGLPSLERLRFGIHHPEFAEAPKSNSIQKAMQDDFTQVSARQFDEKWIRFVKSKWRLGNWENGFQYLGKFTKVNDDLIEVTYIPVPLTLSETIGESTWSDDVRINLGISAIRSQTAKSLLLIQFPVGTGMQEYVFPAKQDDRQNSVYDITQEPAKRSFNISMRNTHWSKLVRMPGYNGFNHWSWTAGFYLSSFEVPTGGNAAISSQNGYFIGGSTSIQRYFTFHGGLAFYDRGSALIGMPAFGISFDPSLIGNIFGQSSN